MTIEETTGPHEFLVGYKASGGFPNQAYLRIEVIEAADRETALAQVSKPLWITEFSRNVPAGMLPKAVSHTPIVTEDSVLVTPQGDI